MSTAVVRAESGWYVEGPDGRARIDTSAVTTGQLLADRAAIAAAGSPEPSDEPLLSPITRPCRVVAQMTNYRSHATESGLDPNRIPPIYFRKASHSIAGPTDDVVKPSHVHFLDYEVEIGLVVGRRLPVGTTVTAANIADYVVGLVVANDVSARDVQLPKTQFYESKSYPTFTPLGPRLLLLDADELARLGELRLTLSVNGESRQDALAADMITGPPGSLTVLSSFQDLDPGDVVLTGTPGGTALVSPPKLMATIGALLPPHQRWQLFFKRQAENPRYLHDGDVMSVRIASDDGRLDLGTQTSRVRSA